ncbi:SLBB domain-containing protein [Roseisolibacter sp. H3M3-2]|uniref:polysaccharide biosynthesis/export family protein n=1 Tax=Roseisolibacter sp. H3M3-2 TaxID=3031323 RepID=UPI0023DC5937|nr:SLBB domain-containing protein [Roseisolibacter sp. H3M3-2]MDF1502855.1 SLBB domain-containing protein [Roseisolibacter sp. H3M3-2]
MRQTGAAADTTRGRAVTSSSPAASRSQLTAAAEAAERAAASGPDRDRGRARSEAAAIRSRLQSGDFQVGDRIGLSFAGDSVVRELTVREGTLIDFPYGVPALSVAGVLRSELTDVVLGHLRKYVRDPEVRLFPLQRLAVSGAVRAPGVYWVRRDLQVSELVMRAGGPDQNARMEKARVVRGGREVLSDKSFARVAREGQTVEEAGLQAGDELRVPARPNRNWAQIGSYAFFGISALTALLALVRASYQ